MKKSKRILLIAAMLFLVSAAVLGILWGISNGNISNNAEQTLVEEVAANDEATLRELLAAEKELIINISEDLEVEEGFTVNGTKTLEGDATLCMSLGAELGQALLMLSEDSSLTLDGPILDCNYNSDGIHVAANATLLNMSSVIKRAGAYGILNYGEITIQDIDIMECEYISICGQSGSEIYMKGGSIQESATNHVYLVAGSHMNISGNTVMDQSEAHGMINYGTLEIHGGTFGNTGNYLCDNYGELTVAYEGNAEEGYIECYGAKRSAFLSRKGSTTNISDVYIHDTTRQAISSLGGDTTVTNCKIENTGSHSIDIQNGKAVIEDVTVLNSQGSGLETRAGAKLTVKNFTVDGCKKIGIACRGANITATKINVYNTEKYGLSCGDSNNKDGVFKVENAEIKGTTKQSVYLYESGKGNFKNIQISDGDSRGVFVKGNATAKIHGESTIKNMALGGVEVRSTLEMDSVVICDNHVKDRCSGAGVYVAKDGKLTMKNGAVYNNSTEVRGGGLCVTDGTITINGTKIHDNSAVKHGGGLYVQKTSVVNLKNGEITDNKSEGYGDGIYIHTSESKVTMGDNFYLGRNDVKLDDVKAVLNISGNSLKKHSASDPLLLTPNYDAKLGVQVAVCKNESVAKSLASKVKSGDGSYNIVRDKKYFAIEYAKADMDMTGADTVYVSNFAELKDAVLSTTSKRYIVLKADIQMETRIRVPGGATICIKDDGIKRTLSRAEGFTNSFFVTHYGTGLYLTGTDAGKLVLDGGYVASSDTTNNLPLVRVAGSTEVRNVVLQNNGSLVTKNAVNGALFKQTYGDFKIYDSVLSGGKAYSGGAVIVQRGEGYIEGTLIKDNESTVGGAGVRVQGGSKLEVVDSTFETNHAGSTGGGICALEASEVIVINTNFDKNTATVHGGALSAQDEGTILSVIGKDKESSVFANNSSEVAGAIYVVKSAELQVTDYVFDNNTATDRAGAVCILGNSNATIENTAFYRNKSGESGGALIVDTSKATVVNCEFGKENAGNVAGAKAGAILVTAKSVVDIKTDNNGTYNSMNYNTAIGHGGAVYVNEDCQANITGYVFEGNKGAAGGAVFVIADGKAVCKDNQYTNNTAISGEAYGNGGAIYCAGTLEDINSSYIGNLAKNGGAVIVMKCGLTTFKGTNADALMQGNTATDKGGGAVYVNNGGNASLSGYVIEDNKGTAGGAVYVAGTFIDVDSKYSENVATGDGGAIAVMSTGLATLNKTTFDANRAEASGGAICILSDDKSAGKVTCENAVFSNNKGLKGTKDWKNGGAVYCAGTFEDANSSYIGNAAKNGGAIFIPAGGDVTLVGTTSEKAVFEDNQAMGATNSRGGAIFVNKAGQAGGSISVTGYTFKENTSTGTTACAVHVIDSCSAELKDVTFQGTIPQKIYMLGSLDFDNLSGAVLVSGNASSNFVVSGYQDGNVIEFTPSESEYVGGTKVLQKSDAMDEEEFKAACSAIAVTPKSDGSSWYINEEGKLEKYIVASIALKDSTETFSTLKAAVEYVNNNGGTGTADAMEIVVLTNASISETLEIRKNATIVNCAGKDVTISRGVQSAYDMFKIAADATLTLGTDEKDETGKFVIDGATTAAIAGRTVTVENGATFTLAKNATLQNANSTLVGAAVHTSSVNTSLYGIIQNNLTTNDGCGLYVAANAKATIQGATFTSNQAGKTGGAINIASGAEVTCENATFTGNKGLKGTTWTNGGAVYCAGTFTDTNSSYIGNEAKNGGAFFVPAGGSVTLTGTDATKAIFKNNTAVTADGGAIFLNNTTKAGSEDGGDISVTGYIFENNTGATTGSRPDSAVYAKLYSNTTLINVTFQGNTDQKLYIYGDLTYNGLSDNIIAGTPTNKKYVVASISGTNGIVYYQTLGEAVAYVNGGTQTADAIEIVVLENASINAALEMNKNTTIVNYSGKNVTISRGGQDVYDMFKVAADATLTLGTNATDETGKFIINGATTAAIAGRTVTVENGATFTLAKNATLQNANSTLAGAAMHTSSVNTSVYGTIQNNVTTSDGGGLYVAANAKATIQGATISSNQAGAAGGGINIQAGAQVTCTNATFSQNKGLSGTSTWKNGGAIYCAGTFTDTNSSYIGNEAKNGGAIFTPTGGNVTIIGTDNSKAIFQDNAAKNGDGGAIFMNNTVSIEKGSSVSITGYIFKNNTSTSNAHNAAYVKKYCSLTLNDVTFQGTTTQKVYVCEGGSLIKENLNGETIVDQND